MNADVPTPAKPASCSCGGLSVVCSGEPMLVALCHCRECQKRTGGPFGVAAFYPEAAVAIAGPSTEYRRTGDSGHEIVFRFCPTCGSTVFWSPLVKPGVIAVALGAFADGSVPAPAKQVYMQHRHPWVPIDIAPDPKI